MRVDRKIILISVFGALSMWVIDAAVDVLFFFKGSFLDYLILDVRPYEIYVRTLFGIGFITFGVIISRVVAKRLIVEEELKKHREHLQDLVMERTSELLTANALLQEEVSERRRAEEGIRLYREIIEHMPIGAQVWHLEDADDAGTFRLISVNPAGLVKEDLLGKTLSESFPAFLKTGLPEMGAEVVRTGKARDLGEVHSGDERFPQSVFSVKVFPLPDSCVGVVFENITERKRIEEALRSREDILEVVALAAEQFLKTPAWEQTIQDVLARLGKTMKVSRVYIFENHIGNDGAQLTSQRHEWAATGVAPQIAAPELQNVDWLASGFGRWVETLSKGQPLTGHVREFPEREREVLNPQDVKSMAVVPVFVGQQWWGFIGFDDCGNEREWSIAEVDALKVAAGTLGAAIQRNQSEDKLRESESRFRELSQQFHTLLEAITDPLTLLSPDLRVLWGNRSAVALTGGRVADISGQHCHSLWHNSPTPCEGCPVVKSFQTGKEEIFRMESRAGRLWDLRAFPVMDERGEVNSVLSVASDVTEKINLEVEARRVAHLASLGELAAGVAHEINNPINGIINYAQILANKSKPESRENEIAGGIIKEGDRIAGIVKSLLSFARAGKAEKNPVSISEILIDSLALTAAQMRKDGITLQTDIPPDLPGTLAHPQQIQQVFLNIINNARYALNQKYQGVHKEKLLKIQGERVTIDNRPLIRIIFYDQGIGIPGDILDKVMNPFFSTKPRGKGTGLGLSISHGIIADHGGKLSVESVEGSFTRVLVQLPAREESGDVKNSYR